MKPVLRFCRSVVPSSEEQEVLDALVAQRDKTPALRGVQMRVVGGWVRDKLLSQSPGDIDVCLSNVTGRQFASSVGEQFNIVAENPDKSKHLETAVVRLGSKRRVVDLSHMRTERYTESSRIPVVEFGSPKEDAMRRDCTINALYYNLDSRQVEDPTGLGLADLEAGVIRGPTTAVVTLRDDPLRLLRLIRFCAALSFRLDDELKEAFLDSQVLQGLEKKVSRERISTEVDKMLLLHREGCISAVSRLASVPGLLNIAFWPRVWEEKILADRVAFNDMSSSIRSSQQLLALRSAAILAPLQSEEHDLTSVFLDRLKWTRVRSRNVLRVLSSLDWLTTRPPAGIVETGLWARSAGEDWWESILELSSHLGDGVVAKEVMSRLQALPLSERAFLPSPLTGEEIGRARALRGRAVGLAKDDLLKWQMDAPDVSKEAALEYLKQQIY